MTDMTPEQWRVYHAAMRMQEWAEDNPQADTQGITDDEWWGLAQAALGTVPMLLERPDGEAGA